jgi:ribosome-associated translation inhibitor RaiA
MKVSDETNVLRVDLDSKDFQLSAAEQEKMDGDLETLRRLVKSFPDPELKIELSHQSYYRVRVSLLLPGRTLFTADEDQNFHPAWERCIRKLVKRVDGYKEKLGNKPTYAKEAQGTLHNVRPTMDPDLNEIIVAVDQQDYVAFRRVLSVYDEAIELRAGRWVERYPAAEAKLGHGLAISEIVEEVFLNAFERFNERPPLRMGEWLESLIDPSVKALLEDPAAEKENLSFIQSAQIAESERSNGSA